MRILLLLLSVLYSPGVSFSCFGFLDTETSKVCSNNGDCDSEESCTCHEGFVGETCAFPGCYGVMASNETCCHGNGVCAHNGFCRCFNGFMGDECDTMTCNGFMVDHLDSVNGVCSGHGTCDSPDLCTCQKNDHPDKVLDDSLQSVSYYGAFCEYFECTGNLCKSLVNQDRMVSEEFEYNFLSYAPHIFFTLTMFSIYPNRRPSEVVDCSLLFDYPSLMLLGQSPRCMWKATNTHEFIVYLGTPFALSSDSILKVNLFPFENVADPFYVELEGNNAVPNVFQQFWSGLMEPIPAWAKSPLYQAVGFCVQYWIWILVVGGIFLIFTCGSSFFSFFFCCDPRKIRQQKNVAKVRKVNRNIKKRREEREKKMYRPRRVAIQAQHVAKPFTDSFRGSIEPRGRGKQRAPRPKRTRSQDFGYSDYKVDLGDDGEIDLGDGF